MVVRDLGTGLVIDQFSMKDIYVCNYFDDVCFVFLFVLFKTNKNSTIGI